MALSSKMVSYNTDNGSSRSSGGDGGAVVVQRSVAPLLAHEVSADQRVRIAPHPPGAHAPLCPCLPPHLHSFSTLMLLVGSFDL